MTGKGTPLKTSVFRAYLPKTVTHFAITVPCTHLSHKCPTHLSHDCPTHSSHECPTHLSYKCPTHLSHECPTHSSHECPTHSSHKCPILISHYVLTSHFMYVWKIEHRCASQCCCSPTQHTTSILVKDP